MIGWINGPSDHSFIDHPFIDSLGPAPQHDRSVGNVAA
jgi:hypothetical protein